MSNKLPHFVNFRIQPIRHFVPTSPNRGGFLPHKTKVKGESLSPLTGG